MHPLFSLEGRKDPHPIYRRLRREAPVTRIVDPHRKAPVWLLTRYDDCVQLLRDSRFSKDYRKFGGAEVRAVPELAFLGKHMLTADPPDHTRLRSLVSKAFTPQRVDALRGRISSIAEALLGEAMAAGRREMELIAEFSYPLPVTVIAELLGVPARDRERFRRWSTTLVAPVTTAEQSAVHAAAELEFLRYFTALIERRRAEPRDDLVSALVAAEEEAGEEAGDRLSSQELVGMLFLLLFAGHETTVNLITNGMLALMDHPEQRERLAINPSLLESAVEEMLRYCGPVETTTDRFAREDLEIRDVVIRRGDLVVGSLLSAHRDETRFPDPEQFDVGRTPNKHVAFGFGIHFCLGASLARLEAAIAVDLLTTRLPHMRLAMAREALVPSSMLLLMHGKQRLPVTF